MIGCDCAVCRSTDPRDRRTRPSILIELQDNGVAEHAVRAARCRSILVDTSTDLRAQALAQRRPPRRRDPLHAQPRRSRARPRRGAPLQPDAADADPAATPTQRTLADLRRMFAYIFDAGRGSRAAAFRRSRCSRSPAPFTLGGVEIVPVPLLARPSCRSSASGRLVRVPDRLQPHPRRVVAAARRRAHARARRAARPAAPDALQRRRGARRRRAARRRSARTSRTSATTCRTPPPARACPPAWSWPMMGWCWRS